MAAVRTSLKRNGFRKPGWGKGAIAFWPLISLIWPKVDIGASQHSSKLRW